MADSGWAYRLFLSVDLQNSTGFKKKAYKDGVPQNAEWAWVFEDFYSEFSDIFFLKLNNYTNLVKPNLWKCLGDEIIYQIEINDSADVEKYVLSFRDSILSYNAKSPNNKEKPLQAQGTVWGAGFPIRNHRVTIPNGNGQEDFVGLDIDIGFRISKYSKPERLVISLPIAYILSKYNCENIRYYDEINAKGVDSEYPIFWILSSKNPKTPGRLLLSPSPIDAILDFCSNYFDNVGNPAYSKPFIENDKSNLFCEIDEKMRILKEENDKAELERKGRLEPLLAQEPSFAVENEQDETENSQKLQKLQENYQQNLF
ncbi:MAG: hypothetical protein MJY87_06890 [Fibrobacter sp.]|nr:hypothetical protein [Fibrobacter sp.]